MPKRCRGSGRRLSGWAAAQTQMYAQGGTLSNTATSTHRQKHIYSHQRRERRDHLPILKEAATAAEAAATESATALEQATIAAAAQQQSTIAAETEQSELEAAYKIACHSHSKVCELTQSDAHAFATHYSGWQTTCAVDRNCCADEQPDVSVLSIFLLTCTRWAGCQALGEAGTGG